MVSYQGAGHGGAMPPRLPWYLMNNNPIIVALYFVIPLVMSVGAFLMKSLWENQVQRIDSLETRMQHTTTDAEVRQLVSDRYDPLVQDIKEIKDMQQKCMDLIIQSLRTHKGLN